MYIKNKYFSLIFKIFIVVIGIYGLYDSCFKTENVSLGEHFSYFTNLSNLLCIIFYIIYTVKMLLHKENHNLYHYFKGPMTLCITITCIVYNFILRPFMTDMDGVMKLNSIGNYIVHLILPIMVIIDYVLFDKKGLIKKTEPFTWIILPFLYWIFICIRAFLGKTFVYTDSKYPYFFLDIDTFGLPQIILNVVLAIILILILGFIFVFIDNILFKKILIKINPKLEE